MSLNTNENSQNSRKFHAIINSRESSRKLSHPLQPYAKLLFEGSATSETLLPHKSIFTEHNLRIWYIRKLKQTRSGTNLLISF